MSDPVYIAIDLKSFYASVECVDRHLNPLTVNLVVADPDRTEKTICLAVSPSLKACGIPGRPRLFEVIQKVREINQRRLFFAPGHKFRGKSIYAPVLAESPSLELDYLVAVPRMARYMEVSSQIYHCYLKYVAPEHIHVYSIDEVFIDAAPYLRLYKLSAREFAMQLILDVLHSTGITATAGIGTNLYLCKIAMDIVAKHIPADRNGVRIAELDEMSYRKKLWSHRPITDFWRIGQGYAARLASRGMSTMGDVARMSVSCEDLLYRMFGVNAELLIDHAWGWEPCTIADIKSYKPASNSISSGQVLQEAYDFEKARLVALEMTDMLSLDLVEKHLVTDQLVLNIGYDVLNLTDTARREQYHGPVKNDRYGRELPQAAHGSMNLELLTSSTKLMTEAAARLFDLIVSPGLLIRRINVTANHVVNENEVKPAPSLEQLDLFTDVVARRKDQESAQLALKKENNLQHAILDIQKKLGKNAILKGMNLQDGATARERNRQIGGHRK